MASTMQLEFSQAMSDFKTMFPEMDRDVIEAVLRANQGAVDATIDQLLAMSTDNQNERLRNELDKSNDTDNTSTPSRTIKNPSDTKENPLLDIETSTTDTMKNQLLNAVVSANSLNTGASPKIKKSTPITSTIVTTTTTTSSSSQQSTPVKNETNRRWNPPMLGPLPSNFLRLSNIDRNDYDLPDEQFALMLQNEEFMNELRWNQEFMSALEREQQHGKDRTEDDAAFKERLKHMGKVSRKKFLQMARVFTWQRNKKPNSARHLDSLPLKEEPSDDEELVVKKVK